VTLRRHVRRWGLAIVVLGGGWSATAVFTRVALSWTAAQHDGAALTHERYLLIPLVCGLTAALTIVIALIVALRRRRLAESTKRAGVAADPCETASSPAWSPPPSRNEW